MAKDTATMMGQETLTHTARRILLAAAMAAMCAHAEPTVTDVTADKKVQANGTYKLLRDVQAELGAVAYDNRIRTIQTLRGASTSIRTSIGSTMTATAGGLFVLLEDLPDSARNFAGSVPTGFSRTSRTWREIY